MLFRSKSQRPQWADPQVDSCYICDTVFNWSHRQHHCRKCGTVRLPSLSNVKAVCSKCSNWFLSLPDLGYKKQVRVCKTCAQVELMKRRHSSRISGDTRKSDGAFSHRASQGGIILTNENLDMEFSVPKFNSFHSIKHHNDLVEELA